MKNNNNPISAQITLQYDTDITSMYFDEVIDKSPLVGWSYNECCNVFQYTGYESELIERTEDLFEITENDRDTLISFLCGDYTDKEFYEDFTNDELKDEILSETDFVDLDETNEISLEKKYVMYSLSGYSQGDTAYCIVLKEDDAEWMKERLHNLFYDAPIWGRIEIFTEQGQDYEFELYDIPGVPEYLNYPQDIDFVNEKIMKFIEKKFQYVPAKQNIINAVKDALPDEIKYPKYC